jgi:hypothetical protein
MASVWSSLSKLPDPRTGNARRHPDEAPMPGLAMIGMVEATTTRGGTTATIRRFYLSSVAMEAPVFAAIVRAHWPMPTSWHCEPGYRRDTSHIPMAPRLRWQEVTATASILVWCSGQARPLSPHVRHRPNPRISANARYMVVGQTGSRNGPTLRCFSRKLASRKLEFPKISRPSACPEAPPEYATRRRRCRGRQQRDSDTAFSLSSTASMLALSNTIMAAAGYRVCTRLFISLRGNASPTAL